VTVDINTFSIFSLLSDYSKINIVQQFDNNICWHSLSKLWMNILM